MGQVGDWLLSYTLVIPSRVCRNLEDEPPSAPLSKTELLDVAVTPTLVSIQLSTQLVHQEINLCATLVLRRTTWSMEP
ncbi:hypothetical protein CAEBREN_32474, partial [Caenorhabditis brenneri]